MSAVTNLFEQKKAELEAKHAEMEAKIKAEMEKAAQELERGRQNLAIDTAKAIFLDALKAEGATAKSIYQLLSSADFAPYLEHLEFISIPRVAGTPGRKPSDVKAKSKGGKPGRPHKTLPINSPKLEPVQVHRAMPQPQLQATSKVLTEEAEIVARKRIWAYVQAHPNINRPALQEAIVGEEIRKYLFERALTTLVNSDKLKASSGRPITYTVANAL
jgi:hypothetical protein